MPPQTALVIKTDPRLVQIGKDLSYCLIALSEGQDVSFTESELAKAIVYSAKSVQERELLGIESVPNTECTRIKDIMKGGRFAFEKSLFGRYSPKITIQDARKYLVRNLSTEGIRTYAERVLNNLRNPPKH